MTKFQKCILVCFIELLILLVCLTGVLATGIGSGKAEDMAIAALITFLASLFLVIVFASVKPKGKDKAPDEKV